MMCFAINDDIKVFVRNTISLKIGSEHGEDVAVSSRDFIFEFLHPLYTE